MDWLRWQLLSVMLLISEYLSVLWFLMRQFWSHVHTVITTQAHTHTLTHIEMYPGACVSCRAETVFSFGQGLIFRSPPLVSVFLDWIESVKRERMRGEGVWGVRWTLKHYTQAERLNWSAWLPVSTGCKNPYRFVLHLKPTVAFTWRSSETKYLTNQSQPNKSLASVS